MAFCSKCGTANDDGTRFCGSCGTAIVLAVPVVPIVSANSIDWEKLSIGSKLSGVGAAVGLLLFFFPWVDIMGSAKFSGMSIAFKEMPKTLILLAVPATALGTLWSLYQSLTGKTAVLQIAVVGFVGGIASLGGMVWLFWSASREIRGMGVDLFTIWYWLSVLASIAIIAGAVKARKS